jgi:hypothetical protein
MVPRRNRPDLRRRSQPGIDPRSPGDPFPLRCPRHVLRARRKGACCPRCLARDRERWPRHRHPRRLARPAVFPAPSESHHGRHRERTKRRRENHRPAAIPLSPASRAHQPKNRGRRAPIGTDPGGMERARPRRTCGHHRRDGPAVECSRACGQAPSFCFTTPPSGRANARGRGALPAILEEAARRGLRCVAISHAFGVQS